MLCCALGALLLSCDEEGHAPYGTGGGGNPENPGGTDGDTDSDSDNDADADTDTGTDTGDDTDTGPAGCSADEVEGPSGLQCWRRCPEGETWDDGYCSGTAVVHDFTGAVGACALLGGGFHAATRDELIGLLANCEDAVVDDGAEGLCDSCTGSDVCFEMFGTDTATYWSSTDGDPGPWVVAFDVGTVELAESADLPYFVRCVRGL